MKLKGKSLFMVMGLSVLALTLLFPPWEYETNTRYHRPLPLGLHFLLTPPYSYQYDSTQIDSNRLFMEWMVIGAVFGICWIIQKEKGKV